MSSLISVFALFSLCLVVLMTILSACLYFYQKDVRAGHMLEHWGSYSLYFFVTFLTNVENPRVVALASLCWLWRMKTIRQLLEDISRVKIHRPWHDYVMGAGVLLSVWQYFLKDPSFIALTIPYTTALCIVGLHMVTLSAKGLKGKKNKGPHYLYLGTNVLIFVHIFNYSFLRYDPDLSVYGFMVVLITLFLTAVLLPSIMLVELANDHADSLQELVEKRTQQLIYQSKFSALGEMAAGMAHEVNNPLSVISGKAQQLKRLMKNTGYDPEKLLSGLEMIEITSFRISKIIKGLKDFSRNSDNIPMKIASLESIINETLDLCGQRFYHYGISLRINAIPSIGLECRSIQVSQVLLNLLNNAFDAALEMEDKWVEIDIEEHPHAVVLKIKDSGKGIPEELKTKIMMPFFTTKEVGKGTGLGLSISKGIVEDHRGKFYLDSTSAKTCFVVELPKLIEVLGA